MISKASTETLKMKEIMLDVCRFFSVRVSTISIFVGMHVRVVAGLAIMLVGCYHWTLIKLV